MDLKGSLVDTSLRIYPSKKLINFLESESLSDIVPANIGKFVKGEDYKPKGTISIPSPTEINLSDKDIKSLNKFKSLVTDTDCKNTTEENKEKNTTEENKENCSPNIVSKLDENDSGNNSKSDANEEIKPQGIYLTTSDVEWLYSYLKERRTKDSNIPYLHDLLEGSNVEVPPNQVIKRNPDLEARCVKLRAQQEAREYRKMTKGVDNVRMKFPEDSISYQCMYIFLITGL